MSADKNRNIIILTVILYAKYRADITAIANLPGRVDNFDFRSYEAFCPKRIWASVAVSDALAQYTLQCFEPCTSVAKGIL